MKNKYEEFFVTDGNGNMFGYCETYAEALEKASKIESSEIYGSRWFPSRSKGLLHKDWERVIPV